jgi:hypothetical protein
MDGALKAGFGDMQAQKHDQFWKAAWEMFRRSAYKMFARDECEQDVCTSHAYNGAGHSLEAE